MQPDARALLWDAHRAAVLIDGFVAGRTWGDYEDDPMLRSAVERQFEIVGEALNRLSQVDPPLAAEIRDLPRIVAFRNVLVHGYATIDDAVICEVVTTRLGPLIELLVDLPVIEVLSCASRTLTKGSSSSKPEFHDLLAEITV